MDQDHPGGGLQLRSECTMSLRTQFSLLLTLAVVLAVVFASTVVRRAAVEPLQTELTRSRIHHTFRIAEQLRAGSSLEDIRKRVHLAVELRETSPMAESEEDPSVWRSRQIRGRRLLVREGSDPAVALKLRKNWLVVSEDWEVGGPSLMLMLALGGFVLLVGVVWSGQAITRPLKDTQIALSRVSEGDFSQTLDERGGAELEAVARSFNLMSKRVLAMLSAEKQLMAGISHELRTPLARLRLQVELLRDQGLSEDRLLGMEANLEELDLLIGEFLELSRLESGAAVLNLQPVDLRSLVESILGSVPEASRFSISGSHPTVRADSDRIRRVFSTLIENAVKYAPEGPVEIHLLPNGFTIRDHGPGVEVEELPQLFKPFYRGSSSKDAQGFGIGLSMAHQIVSLHKGGIDARNHPEGGLEIQVRLDPNGNGSD